MARTGFCAANLPWVTLAVVTVGWTVATIPGADEFLQYERAATESGDYWRLLSSQTTHWTARMAVADLLVLLVAGTWLELCSRRLVTWTLLATGLSVGSAIHGWIPDLALYRGSSGLASGLFAAVALDILWSRRPGWLRALALSSLALLGAKTVWETVSGQAVFAGELPVGVVVVPPVHLAGIVTGALSVAIARVRLLGPAGRRQPRRVPDQSRYGAVGRALVSS